MVYDGVCACPQSYPPVTDLGYKTELTLRQERQKRTVSQVRRIGTDKSMLRFERHNRDTADRQGWWASRSRIRRPSCKCTSESIGASPSMISVSRTPKE